MGSWKWPESRQKVKRNARPRFLELRSSPWFITLVVSFAGATDVFMYGLIVPVTPTALKTRVGISEDTIQAWNSTLLALFGAALLASSPLVGHIADRSASRRWPYLCGLASLAVTTALLCVGTNIAFWIVGRLCQGAAASVVWVVGNALLADTVGTDGVGEVMGYTTMAASIGIVGGPLLGGVVYENGGYYAVFGLAFGLIGLDVILRLILIEKRHAIEWLAPEEDSSQGNQQGTELSEAGKVSAGSLANSPDLINDPDSRAPAPETASLGAFGRVRVLLSMPRVLVSLWGTFVVSIILTSFDSVLPLFVQETFGWKQSGQGLIFIPLMIPHILSPVTGSFVDRFPRASRYMTAGAFLFSLPVLVLLRLVTHNSMPQKVLLCALLSLVGICLAIVLPPLDAEVFHAVDEKEKQVPGIFGKGGAVALAFGLTNMGFATGSLVGPFLAGFIRQNAGWGTMGWVLGLVTGVSSLPILFFMGGWILREPIVSEEHVATITS